MSDCTHKYRTIDCFCNDCGSSEVLDLIYEDIRQQERERIAMWLKSLDSEVWVGINLQLADMIEGKHNEI